MPPSTPVLLLLRLHLLLLLLSPSFQQSYLSPEETSALRDIRSSLRDLPGSNFFSTWDFAASADPCAAFAGVICSADQDTQFLHVTVLTLGTGLSLWPGLAGTISPSIARLAALTELVVYPGRISGPIPNSIGYSLRRLRFLSISDNLISGQIPDSLAGIPDLHTIDLGRNRLQGPIPPALFSSSPSLKVLILASNGNLSGDLPPDISAAVQLRHLDLRRNFLTGRLPPLPPSLRYLSVSGNSMSGPIDAALAAPPPDLSFLDLSMNRFTGPIPPAILALPGLGSLLLHRNKLSGTLPAPPPDSLAAPWTVVDLSHNMIYGEVPAGLAGAGSLYLNNNRLSGAVPAEYARRVYGGGMSTFYAQHNFLTAFPAPARPLPEAVSLCLSYNCMVPPSSAAAGCPASAGTQETRPPSQCPYDAARGGDG